jgi:hypothetical protein
MFLHPRPEQLSEVLLGGLIKRLDRHTVINNADDLRFDFYDTEVRRLLQNLILRDEIPPLLRSIAQLPKVKLDLNPDPSRFKGDRLPVETVSWEEAKEFIARLNAKLGLGEENGYRLPSEAARSAEAAQAPAGGSKACEERDAPPGA